MVYRRRRETLYRILQQHPGGRKEQEIFLLNRLISETGIEGSEEKLKILKKDVSRFCRELFRRLDIAGRKLDRFLKCNENWLDQDFI